MRLSLRVPSLVAALAGCAALISTSRADLLTPNGNPTGPSIAWSPVQPGGGRYHVDLSPTQAYLASPGNVLREALAIKGISEENGWNIQDTQILWGNFTLNMYAAWTERTPDLSLGTLNPVGPIDLPGAGGAAIKLTYADSPWDPPQADLHWLQLIVTNDPLEGRAYAHSENPLFVSPAR